MVDLGSAAPILFAAAIGLGTADTPPAPISLVTRPGPAGVTLQVVGDSPTPVEASYSLEVTSGAGGNRSLQRGSVRLRPSQRAVLLTARLGGAAGSGWKAKLTVTPKSGDPYEVRREAE